MLVSLNVDNTREAISELAQQDYPIIGGAHAFVKGVYFLCIPKMEWGCY